MVAHGIKVSMFSDNVPPSFSLRHLWRVLLRLITLLIRLHETHEAVAWLGILLDQLG